ncbi:hypothetical protein BDV40DRAFT_270247 [Aspergillus tamarii]|uniref:Uncharacterized protein n=1 Tax=Aspergillus tamarii TaxID=41984 RepID=A0A5N6UQ23_ASPTM|nr:hypothetical protein BDV40DRAFT_270247 [Aspergillus tamarii]
MKADILHSLNKSSIYTLSLVVTYAFPFQFLSSLTNQNHTWYLSIYAFDNQR